MGQFLRDQQITNVTLDEARLRGLVDLMGARAQAANVGQEDTSRILYPMFVIRFDNKGYRVFDVEELMRLFLNAKKIERVICAFETTQSWTSNRVAGARAEVALDARNPNGCNLVVTADSEQFVDATFAALSERLQTFRNHHRLVRSAWTAFILQIVGIVVGFILCLWGARFIAPSLAIENALIFSFLFLLLIFSNIWTYLNQALLRGLDTIYPNVLLVRPRRDIWHWLPRTIVGGLVVGVVTVLLLKLLSYGGVLLGQLLK